MNMKVADAKREEGFTLIELLVVVIIIGILAAIAIPLFLNQRQRAWQGSAESDARNAAIEIETRATRAGTYPASTGTGAITAADIDMFASDGVRVYYALGSLAADGSVDTADTLNFVLCADHEQISTSSVIDERVLYESSEGGLQEWDDSAGCATGAPWVLIADGR